MGVHEDTYPNPKDRMSRARTPLGAVPISTIYGFDYPITNGVEKDFNDRHESSLETDEVQTTGRVKPLWNKGKLTDAVDHMIRSTRAYSENRLSDPYYSSDACSGLSFMPMALRASRANTPARATSILRETSVPPVPRTTARKLIQEVSAPAPAPRTATLTFSSTSPWDSTGFYYSPRYPQSHRGTASTYSSYSRRYPVRRFVPSYVPFRYSRRY